jgi:hypothetical protein
MGNVLSRARGSHRRGRVRAGLIVVGVVTVVAAGTAIGLLVAPPPAEPGAASPTSIAREAGADPAATPVAGSEVQTPGPADPPGDRLPTLPSEAPPTSPVSLPLPPSGSREGAIVEGFPAELAGPAEGSDILDTSIASEGDMMQFSLIARTDAGGDAVRAYYAGHWTARGMAPDGLGFRDSFTSISVTIHEDSGTGTVYTVHGVARAA